MVASNTDRLAESVNKPSVGRVYDYLLGGVHNYAVDREFAEEQLKLLPEGRNFARSNRAFLSRVVRFAVESGVRQFVDIGSGLPTQGNVHEVADEVAPGECRVVYIDNEPIAQAHAEVLLERTADPQRHRAIDADFFDGSQLWQQVLNTDLINPDEPIALLLVALLHFMPMETEPEQVLAYYRGQLPKGSLLALSHIAFDSIAADDTDKWEDAESVQKSYHEQTNNPVQPRTREQITELFTGLELVDPGLVWLPQWRPSGEDPYRETPERSLALAGVGRKV